ncbi:MAG: hypothetical protein I3273_04505 [Candidatus Moeniiplasma glomeromycotorum]|nr:hypothetical protein [Candidatus Moeniiplasma glomeromycotorum]
MSKEKVEWFTEFSYSFLYALQNNPMPKSEKVVLPRLFRILSEMKGNYWWWVKFTKNYE